MSYLQDFQSVQLLKNEFLKALPGALRHAVLYGSAVSGDYIPDVSDINLMFFIDPANTGLRPPAALLRKARSVLRTTPQVWTLDGLPNLGRTFPVEMSEIADHHKCLLGEDPISGTTVPVEALKIAAHSGLLRVQLKVRQDAWSAHPDRSPYETLYDLIFLTRAVMRIKGVKPARTKLDGLDQFSERFDVLLPTTKILLRVRQGDIPPPGAHEMGGMYDYYSTEVDRVVQAAGEAV